MRSVAESPVSMETWFMSVSCAGSVVSVPCLLIKSSCSLFIIGSPPFKYLWIAVVGFIGVSLCQCAGHGGGSFHFAACGSLIINRSPLAGGFGVSARRLAAH